MPLPSILAEAEKRASGELDQIRERIVLRVLGADGFSGVAGQQIRASVETAIDGLSKLNFDSFLNEAFSEGIRRAESGKVVSYMLHDIGPYSTQIAKGLRALESSMDADITRLLHRASLANWDKQTVIDKIGASKETGLFREYGSRIRGVVDHALTGADSYAYAEASKMVAKRITQDHAIKNAIGGKDKGLVALTMKTWRHSGGGNPPRINHIAMDSKSVPVDMNFKLIGRNGETLWTVGPHGPELPADEVINCFAGDTMVRGNFVVAMRFLYRGNIRHIKTRSGVSFSVTPNHPIATPNGWVAASKLDKGCDILVHGSVAPELNVAVVNLHSPSDDKDKPARIDEVFRALSLAGRNRSVGMTAFQFDGDTKRGQGYVDVVCANRELLNGAGERSSELRLPHSDATPTPHTPDGAASLNVDAVALSTPLVPSAGALPFDSDASGLPDMLPLQVFGFGAIPDFDAAFLEVRGDRSARDSGVIRDFVNRVPGMVSTDEIVEVIDGLHEGYVYDLQSESGLIVVGNVDSCSAIVSNCHCDAPTEVIYVAPEEEKTIRAEALATGGYYEKRIA